MTFSIGRAAKAAAMGLFDAEIIPVTTTVEDASGQTKTVTVSVGVMNCNRGHRCLLSCCVGKSKTDCECGSDGL